MSCVRVRKHFHELILDCQGLPSGLKSPDRFEQTIRRSVSAKMCILQDGHVATWS